MLFLIYILVTLVTAGSVLWHGAAYAGVAGIVGPIMCWFAGSGFRGSMATVGRHRAAGFGAALLFTAIGNGIVYHSGFSLDLVGHSVPGIAWCLIGLVFGWM